MPESAPDVLPAQPKAGPETFASFLQCLHADSAQAGREYTRLRDKLRGFFELRGDSDPDTAADETLDRAASKLAGGVNAPHIGNYCLGVARLVALERQRQAMRERQAFSQLAETRSDPFDAQMEQAYQLMARCLEKLPRAEQELLTDYCRNLGGGQRARQREALATAWQTTPAGLRLRVHRLRLRLAECVKVKVAK